MSVLTAFLLISLVRAATEAEARILNGLWCKHLKRESQGDEPVGGFREAPPWQSDLRVVPRRRAPRDGISEETGEGSSLINHAKSALNDKDARRILSLALHLLQPAHSSGHQGGQVQLPELSPGADLARRALQKVLAEIQVCQLRVRRTLGFSSRAPAPQTNAELVCEASTLPRRLVSGEADVPDIVGVNYLSDLGIGREAEDGEGYGDCQEDQIEVRRCGLGRNV